MASEPTPTTSEPRGCPLPGACSALVEIERLRAENERLKAAIEIWPETFEHIGKWLRLVVTPETFKANAPLRTE